MASKSNIPWGWIAVAVAALLVFNVGGITDKLTSVKFGGSSDSGSNNVVYTVDPTSSTALKLSVQNVLNTTGTEQYDMTGYIYTKDGSFVATITDTTDPSGVDVNYGEDYVVKFVASSDANSKIKKVISGPCTVTSDGFVEFTADKGEISCIVGGTQHGTLTFKLYDEDEAGFVYYEGAGSTIDWQGDGVVFTSTVNGTAKNVGTNGYLHGTLLIKGSGSDKDFQDYYALVLVDSPLNEWKLPAMMAFDGVQLTEMKDSMTSEEKTKFAEYEYVYKITAPFEDTIHKLEIYMEAKDGVNPSTGPQIDFAVAGNYKSTSSYDIKTGAAKDDSSNTVVYEVMDTQWSIQ